MLYILFSCEGEPLTHTRDASNIVVDAAKDEYVLSFTKAEQEAITKAGYSCSEFAQRPITISKAISNER